VGRLGGAKGAGFEPSLIGAPLGGDCLDVTSLCGVNRDLDFARVFAETSPTIDRQMVATRETPPSFARRAIRRHHPRQEPGAVIPLAGICAGGAGQPASLPRRFRAAEVVSYTTLEDTTFQLGRMLDLPVSASSTNSLTTI